MLTCEHTKLELAIEIKKTHQMEFGFSVERESKVVIYNIHCIKDNRRRPTCIILRLYKEMNECLFSSLDLS